MSINYEARSRDSKKCPHVLYGFVTFGIVSHIQLTSFLKRSKTYKIFGFLSLVTYHFNSTQTPGGVHIESYFTIVPHKNYTPSSFFISHEKKFILERGGVARISFYKPFMLPDIVHFT